MNSDRRVQRMRHTHGWRKVAALLSAAGTCTLLLACAGNGEGREPKASTTVSSADFVRQTPVEEPAPPAKPAPAPTTPATAKGEPVMRPETAEVRARADVTAPNSAPHPSTPEHQRVLNLGGDESAAVAIGSPDLSKAATPSGLTRVVEAHVGQVNGRPIFASEILEPLDGRLRALGTDAKTKDQWQRQAGKSIYDELIRRIRDELVLAEARANLTSEQRQGLVFFLGEIQKTLVAGSGGSAVQADESLRESTSRSLARESQDRLDRELIANELRQRVVPRVSVPWRDVQIEYERNFEKYNPPPIAHLKMIVVDTANAAGVSKVTESLSGGLSFAEVASQKPNDFNRTKAGEFDRDFAGAYAEAKFSEVKEVNEAMQRLTPGQTIGPFPYRDKTAWVHLASIEQRPSKSLYEVQHEIQEELRDERFRQEEARYFDALLKRGNVSKFEDMMAKLLAVAQERYMPAALLAPSRTSPSRPGR